MKCLSLIVLFLLGMAMYVALGDDGLFAFAVVLFIWSLLK